MPDKSAPDPSALPGWLQPFVQITTSLGVPTVFAGILLWYVLQHLGAAVEAIQRDEEVRVRILAAMQDTLVAALDRQTHAFEKAIHENIVANKEIAAEVRWSWSGKPPPRRPGPEE